MGFMRLQMAECDGYSNERNVSRITRKLLLTVGLRLSNRSLLQRLSEWVGEFNSESSSGPIPSRTQSGCVCNVSAVVGIYDWSNCETVVTLIFCSFIVASQLFLWMLVSNLLYILCVWFWMCVGVWKTVERSQWFVSRRSMCIVTTWLKTVNFGLNPWTFTNKVKDLEFWLTTLNYSSDKQLIPLIY